MEHFILGATWFRREQVWLGLHVEEPISLVKRSETTITADDYSYALAA
jgi:hypothetical protein